MSGLKFVQEFASAGIRANAWCNGFLVACSPGLTPYAVRRRVEPFMASGKNLFELELVDPGPPPPDEKDRPDLETSLHLVGAGAEPNDANAVVSYAFSPGEIAPSPEFQLVLRHVVGVGKVETPRAWDRAANLLPNDVASVLATGLAEVRRAIETGQGLAALSEIHAQDHAAITDVSVGDALDDVAALLAAITAGQVRVDFAGAAEIVASSIFDGRVVQGRTRTGRPLLLATHGEIVVGLSPAFGMIDGRVRVLRWS